MGRAVCFKLPSRFFIPLMLVRETCVGFNMERNVGCWKRWWRVRVTSLRSYPLFYTVLHTLYSPSHPVPLLSPGKRSVLPNVLFPIFYIRGHSLFFPSFSPCFFFFSFKHLHVCCVSYIHSHVKINHVQVFKSLRQQSQRNCTFAPASFVFKAASHAFVSVFPSLGKY